MATINQKTVLDLQAKMDIVNPKCVFSAFTYWSWNHYGINLEYEFSQETPSIFFIANSNVQYLNYTNDVYNYEMPDQDHNKHQILAPITPNLEIFVNVLSKQISSIMAHCAKCLGVYVDDITNEQLEALERKFEIQKIFTVRSNYLYTREQLEKMGGKKMQKKRNHLNFYLKNFADKTVIKELFEIPFSEIMAYLQNWSSLYTKFDTEAELEFVKECEDFIKQKIIKGIGIYLEGKLIGLTISFQHGDYCEILVEHAAKDVHGSYQYLISKNISINHPDVLFIDRQDDMWSDQLDHIKRTYKPIEVIEKHFLLIKGLKNA
ncbi:phosphatidylglycerol lysyltransferase domain-containing protein [[Mycoplasma] testudinis]|uniref:phosphatidylglycerol lysyltransferase domain-containing protein n=1 Tax=[Mycoplasma] testudinis TaxID=33924 RepID=UPI000489E491|nr:phosphatidylglycerol lysyltransferase domain-containing protein [[Mycoplasma] testudinis]